jgi:glyoxylase-like metal-dependent hydrolase (beta-lactamase superfamily II)
MIAWFSEAEMNLKSKFFEASEITAGTTAIAGKAGELCYLLEGKDKALLIDTLCGAGNLKAHVRELTDLPVTLVNTHGHLDHIGGNFDFDACWIHPADIPMMYEVDAQARYEGVIAMGQGMYHLEMPKMTVDDFAPVKPLKTYPLYDGQLFDLGDREILTIAVPGHTMGSVVFLDRNMRIVFSGDACNANTLVISAPSTTIEEYREGLLHFKTFQNDFDAMYGGHGLHAVPRHIIDEAIALCGEIMAGKDDALPSDFMGQPALLAKKRDGFMRADGKIANIVYRKENIFKPKERAAL